MNLKKYPISALSALACVAIVASCALVAYAAGPAGIVDKLSSQPGASAVARTQSAKRSDIVSVKDYGAKCDGATDDTAAFQKTIDASQVVAVPAGTCSLSSVALRTSTQLSGAGDATILKQKAGSSLGMLWVDSGSSSVASNVAGIVIRDLQLRGTVDTTGFSEHVYLMSLNGVSNAVIERVTFRGFRGDGLYLGSSQTAATERHNVNVTVRNSVFDGIHKQNRNAISVIDGDGVTIADNVFVNTTRSDMPGAVDIEPDGHAFHVVQNIRITKNKFKNIGGTGGAVTIYRSGGAAVIRNVLVEANEIDGIDGAGVAIMNGRSATAVASDPDALFIVRGNTIRNTKYPFTLQGVKNALVEKNLIEGSTNDAQIGNYKYDYQTVVDVTVSENTFKGCGTSGQIALSVFKADRVRIVRNTFNDCGNSRTGSSAIDLGMASRSSNLAIEQNTFIQGGRMLKAITKQSSHVDSPITRVVSGNVFSGLANDLPTPTAARSSAQN